jgi:hypothetical protein
LTMTGKSIDVKARRAAPLPLFTESPRRRVFSETRTAPVLLHQDREMLPPSHRTGYKRCEDRF